MPKKYIKQRDLYQFLGNDPPKREPWPKNFIDVITWKVTVVKMWKTFEQYLYI